MTTVGDSMPAQVAQESAEAWPGQVLGSQAACVHHSNQVSRAASLSSSCHTCKSWAGQRQQGADAGQRLQSRKPSGAPRKMGNPQRGSSPACHQFQS